MAVNTIIELQASPYGLLSSTQGTRLSHDVTVKPRHMASTSRPRADQQFMQRISQLANNLPRALFGEVEGSVISRIWSSPLFSTAVDASITSVLAVTLFFLFGWCVPSTYAIKRKYLRFVSKSRLINRLERSSPYLLLFLAFIWIKEYRRVLSLRRHAGDLVLARRTNMPASAAAGDISDKLLDATRRKYRSGFGIWCVCGGRVVM